MQVDVRYPPTIDWQIDKCSPIDSGVRKASRGINISEWSENRNTSTCVRYVMNKTKSRDPWSGRCVLRPATMRDPTRRPRVMMKFWTRFNKLSETEGENSKTVFKSNWYTHWWPYIQVPDIREWHLGTCHPRALHRWNIWPSRSWGGNRCECHE